MSRTCIYCGSTIKRMKRGEHVVPLSLGGTRTIKVVCQRCNESFSKLDDELASRSFLNSVKADCLNKPHETGWCTAEGVDFDIDGLYTWKDESFRPWSQLVLYSESRCAAICDLTDLGGASSRQAFRVFCRCARAALKRHEHRRRDGFHYVAAPAFLKRARPKISLRKSLSDCSQKSTFHLIYSDPSHCRLLFNLVEKFDPDSIAESPPRGPVEAPRVYRQFDVGLVVRALTKVAINLLAHELGSTFTPSNFRSAISLIRGESRTTKEHFANAGFCAPSDLSDLHGEKSEHAFELINYGDRRWICYSSWFGGRACTVVAFAGGNVAEFQSLRVRFKFAAGESNHADCWQSTRQMILLPRHSVFVSWSDIQVTLPDFPFDAFAVKGLFARTR